MPDLYNFHDKVDNWQNHQDIEHITLVIFNEDLETWKPYEIHNRDQCTEENFYDLFQIMARQRREDPDKYKHLLKKFKKIFVL